MGVLVAVAFIFRDLTAGEAVLEVDAEVLGGLVPQLGLYQGQHRFGRIRFDAGDRREVGGAVEVGVENVECLGAPPRQLHLHRRMFVDS